MPTTTDYGISYLTSFYNTGTTFPTEETVGATYKGFNDALASWGSRRIMKQQCGQTWLKTFSRINSLYSAAKQLPYLQLVAWNDYEEGTEIESGIDNCLTVSASIVGNALHWTINRTDATFATIATVNRLKIYFSDPGSGAFHTALDNIPPSLTGTQVLTSIIPPGNWKIWVQIVGQPLMMNHLTVSGISYSGGQRGCSR